VKEERIKSALEIAMEKLSDLPELTPEEIQEQKEKEYSPVGEALAKKYLSGAISDGELRVELARHTGEPGEIVRYALAESFCRELHLENDMEISGRALKGLKLLVSGKIKAVERIGNEFREIIEEFDRKTEEDSGQFEVLAIERLGKLGIAGSAIRPNMNEDEHWKEYLHEIQNVFEPRLEDIRNRLMRELQPSIGGPQSAELP
jgi:hypothetical protein